MKVTELTGKSQVFTLKDGSTFRILARQTKQVADSKVSNEMRIAETMGLIMLTEESTEVPQNKKSGGSK